MAAIQHDNNPSPSTNLARTRRLTLKSMASSMMRTRRLISMLMSTTKKTSCMKNQMTMMGRDMQAPKVTIITNNNNNRKCRLL